MCQMVYFLGKQKLTELILEEAEWGEKRTRPVSLEQIEKTVKNLPSLHWKHGVLTPGPSGQGSPIIIILIWSRERFIAGPCKGEQAVCGEKTNK